MKTDVSWGFIIRHFYDSVFQISISFNSVIFIIKDCILWFILRGDMFYVLPCVIFVLVFFRPFSISITSLGEERANLSALRTFVRFVLVSICQFPLPLGVWEGLRFVIVALPGLFSYIFVSFIGNPNLHSFYLYVFSVFVIKYIDSVLLLFGLSVAFLLSLCMSQLFELCWKTAEECI